VRAFNRWGYGGFEWPFFEVEAARPPGPINTPETTIEPQEPGDMKIEWEAPYLSGLKLKKYTIEIRDNSG